jgi:outer membrane protein assembly factor BamB
MRQQLSLIPRIFISHSSNDARFNANIGGTPLWTFPVGAFYSCPAVANGVIYIGSEFNNALYAFHLP